MEKEPETVYIIVKGIYKIHENIGFDRRSIARFASDCHARSGSGFIRKIIIPKTSCPQLKICIICNRIVNICGIIYLVVEIGRWVKMIELDIPKRLATKAIIGWEYCYERFEPLRASKKAE